MLTGFQAQRCHAPFAVECKTDFIKKALNELECHDSPDIVRQLTDFLAKEANSLSEDDLRLLASYSCSHLSSEAECPTHIIRLLSLLCEFPGSNFATALVKQGIHEVIYPFIEDLSVLKLLSALIRSSEEATSYVKDQGFSNFIAGHIRDDDPLVIECLVCAEALASQGVFDLSSYLIERAVSLPITETNCFVLASISNMLKSSSNAASEFIRSVNLAAPELSESISELPFTSEVSRATLLALKSCHFEPSKEYAPLYFYLLAISFEQQDPACIWSFEATSLFCAYHPFSELLLQCQFPALAISKIGDDVSFESKASILSSLCHVFLSCSSCELQEVMSPKFIEVVFDFFYLVSGEAKTLTSDVLAVILLSVGNNPAFSQETVDFIEEKVVALSSLDRADWPKSLIEPLEQYFQCFSFHVGCQLRQLSPQSSHLCIDGPDPGWGKIRHVKQGLKATKRPQLTKESPRGPILPFPETLGSLRALKPFLPSCQF